MSDLILGKLYRAEMCPHHGTGAKKCLDPVLSLVTIDYQAAEIRRQLGGTAEEIVDAAVGKENNDEG